MKIGELAAAADTPVETIRYYEREGLLPAPQRTASNYRFYGEPHLRQLRFIRHCRGLDMSLDEVRALLALRADPQAGCGHADEVLDAHIGHVARRIRELRALEKELKALRALCAAPGEAARCGILEGLASASAKPVPRGRHVKPVHGT
jgi:Cd(II)/Pb(II)-responsive transcriptional regulator